MTCNHDSFKCTNGVFSCLKCGAVIPNPYDSKAQTGDAQEAPKKPTKRKRGEAK